MCLKNAASQTPAKLIHEEVPWNDITEAHGSRGDIGVQNLLNGIVKTGGRAKIVKYLDQAQGSGSIHYIAGPKPAPAIVIDSAHYQSTRPVKPPASWCSGEQISDFFFSSPFVFFEGPAPGGRADVTCTSESKHRPLPRSCKMAQVPRMTQARGAATKDKWALAPSCPNV